MAEFPPTSNSPESIGLLDIIKAYKSTTGAEFPTRLTNINALLSDNIEPIWGNIVGTITNQEDLINYLIDNYQSLDADLTSWAAVVRASGFDTFVTTPSSSNLRSLLSDETGTGSAVFSTSPILATPILSSATSTTAGQLGYDGTCFYSNAASNTRGLIPSKYIMKQHAAYTLTSTNSVQQLFNATTNGRVTLPVGSYRFTCHIYMSSMSNTSGNSQFSLVAGTATLTNFLMTTYGYDAAPVTASGNANLQTAVTSAFGASMQSAGTGTSQVSFIVGTFEVSVAGTVTPSIALVTAASAVVNIGSYIEIESWGTNTNTYIGSWD